MPPALVAAATWLVVWFRLLRFGRGSTTASGTAVAGRRLFLLGG